ncbi:MAG: hypothetical protein JSR43_02545 [Proteobacteria bacterium]|nr:hypothetical protein [Pseudomonadota bacterium]
MSSSFPSGGAGNAATPPVHGGGRQSDAMAPIDADAWSDRAGWQALLAREQLLFEPMCAGASVGFVARASTDAGAGEMLVWRRSAEGMQVAHQPFTGFADCPVALLFVAEPGALEAVHARRHDNALGTLKLQLRAGAMLLYVIVAKRQLLDDGYEDFLEALGLAFLGACR